LLLHTPTETFGKIYFLPGAGNFHIGESAVPAGLKAAGYRGSVEVFNWTTRWMGPAVDQMWLPHARYQAELLAEKIRAYRDLHPTRKIHLIAHSAGTGVALWAIESLPNHVKIDNVVLLASSLSCQYDVSKALQRTRGDIFTFHSDRDHVLKFLVKMSGTVDRQFGVECAGEVGFTPPQGENEANGVLGSRRTANIGYERRYLGDGWHGDHITVVSRKFIASRIAPLILDLHELTPKASRRRIWVPKRS
jgi:pimeloyl-ACP methyl ester carboxylesterase